MSLQLSLRHLYTEGAKQTLPPPGGRGTEQKGKIHPHGKADQTAVTFPLSQENAHTLTI